MLSLLLFLVCVSIHTTACKGCRAGSTSTDHMGAVETNRHLMFNRQVDLQEDGESWLRVSQTSQAHREHGTTAQRHHTSLNSNEANFILME